jgi:hypothetical protein
MSTPIIDLGEATKEGIMKKRKEDFRKELEVLFKKHKTGIKLTLVYGAGAIVPQLEFVFND